MSTEPRQPEDDTDRWLDRVALAAMSQSPDVPTQARIARRRWFGVGMLILAVFCIVLAAIPWPGKSGIDLLMWSAFAIAQLIVGAWQMDKASRDELRALELTNDLAPKPTRAAVRRIK